MKHRSKLSQEQQQQHDETQQSQHADAREFSSAEELLRFDAAQTPVPPEIAERLKRSTADAAPPKTSWLKRFFGGFKP